MVAFLIDNSCARSLATLLLLNYVVTVTNVLISRLSESSTTHHPHPYHRIRHLIMDPIHRLRIKRLRHSRSKLLAVQIVLRSTTILTTLVVDAEALLFHLVEEGGRLFGSGLEVQVLMLLF